MRPFCSHITIPDDSGAKPQTPSQPTAFAVGEEDCPVMNARPITALTVIQFNFTDRRAAFMLTGSGL
jgi:hypothetical protein